MTLINSDTRSLRNIVMVFLLLSVFVRIAEDLVLSFNWENSFDIKIEVYEAGVEEKPDNSKPLKDFWALNNFSGSIYFFEQLLKGKKGLYACCFTLSFYPAVPTPPPDVC